MSTAPMTQDAQTFSSMSAGTGEFHLADVTAAARGEVPAFERLVKANQSLVCCIALAVVRNIEASEEVAQETFIAAWHNLKKLRKPESFRPWLKQLTRCRANDYLRRVTRERKTLSTLGRDGEHALDVASPLPDAREHLLRKEQQRTLEAALEDIPLEASEVLLLYYREGNSVSQVASLLEISEPAARKRLSRARMLLRSEMEKAVGEIARSSAPRAAFTSAVIASLAFAAPSGAAASGIVMSAKAAATGISTAAWSSALAGFAGGLAAVMFGLKKMQSRAMDERERRGLQWVAIAQVLVMIAFLCSLLFPSTVRTDPQMALALVFLYWLGMNLCLVASHLVTSRRRNLQRYKDPVAWKRERRGIWWGLVTSLASLVFVMGLLALIYKMLGRW